MSVGRVILYLDVSYCFRFDIFMALILGSVVSLFFLCAVADDVTDQWPVAAADIVYVANLNFNVREGTFAYLAVVRMFLIFTISPISDKSNDRFLTNRSYR